MQINNNIVIVIALCESVFEAIVQKSDVWFYYTLHRIYIIIKGRCEVF